MTKNKKAILIPILLTILTISLRLLFWWLGEPKVYTLNVKMIEWNYTVRIQELMVVHGEGWDLPEGAYNVTSKKKKHGKEKIGTDSNGDPIYKDKYDPWYTYDVNRWIETRRVTTNGLDKNPYWGEYELYKSNNEMGIGDERVLVSTETYTVSGVLENSKSTDLVSLEISKDLWDDLTTMDQINYKKRKLGKPYDIEIAQ